MSDSSPVVFFGCKNITKTVMEVFLNEISGIDYLITISPQIAELNKVAGYEDLTTFASENNIKCYVAKSYSLKDEIDLEAISNLRLNIGLVIGWQRLIPSKILESSNIGVFGMHGSSANLPKGRGRSPLNWSLILDEEKFYTNLFKYEDNIDGGSIVSSKCFDIIKDDTIETLHFKNLLSMIEILKKNFNNLNKGKIKLKEQNKKGISYYPRRDPSDGIIDWNLSTRHILNFSRALTLPFPGSFTFLDNQKVMIWRMAEFSKSFSYSDSQPGEILEVFYNKKFLVKTTDSVIIVHDYEIESLDNLVKGKIFKSVNFTKSLYEIIERYPKFIKPNQMEVTLENIKEFYSKK